jgi:glycosyltransferase involved in cell wall biosynthesis
VAVCALIPFFNEIETLKVVVTKTLNYVDTVIAVNDGSLDSSEKEIEKLENVITINLDVNSGKGKALKFGFEKALLLNFEKIITIDADLQHDPELIPAIIEKLNLFDVVIGNRLKNLKAMPLQRILSNKITSFLLYIKTGQKILDSQCGFRGYRSSVVKSVGTTYSGFEAESEILVLASKKGFKIGHVEIPTIYRGGKSKMRALKTIFGFLKVLINK